MEQQRKLHLRSRWAQVHNNRICQLTPRVWLRTRVGCHWWVDQVVVVVVGCHLNVTIGCHIEYMTWKDGCTWPGQDWMQRGEMIQGEPLPPIKSKMTRWGGLSPSHLEPKEYTSWVCKCKCTLYAYRDAVPSSFFSFSNSTSASSIMLKTRRYEGWL